MKSVDIKIVARFPWQQTSSPFSLLFSVTSFGTSLYSTTLTFPSVRTWIPTFSSGYAFFTYVDTMSNPCFIMKPAQVGSPSFTSTLSTGVIQTYFTPFFFMWSKAPFSFISRQMTPLPPGAKEMLPSDSIMILPLQSTAGMPPWGKKKMAEGSQPKQLCLEKKSTISLWFISLVIKQSLVILLTSHLESGNSRLANSFNRSRLRTKYSKRVQLDSNPKLNIPLGWSKPSLVPCPPDMIQAPTSPFATASMPSLLNSASLALIQARSATWARGSKFTFPVFGLFLLCRYTSQQS